VKGKETYGFISLVKMVDVAVENLDKQLNRYGGVHARVGHAERALQAFEHTLAVTVEL
jgi:hypothetical protein